MLHVDIHIISTINPDMELIKTSHDTPAGVVHLGLIGQFHYQALERIHRTSIQSSENQNGQPETPPKEHDKEFIEDQEAFQHQAQLRGLPYDSFLQREDTIDATTDNMFTVAPSEGQKLIGILNDKFFEEMCNPTKYPTGRYGLVTERKTRLTVRKYFNQRLLDADGRFAKDIEYLLTAQYDAYARLHKSGSLWLDEFKMIELDEIMRQRGDSQFAQLLCRVRTATYTAEDIKVLESRTITDDHPNYPHDALHAYPRNHHVDEQNKLKLQEIAPEEQHEIIKFIDKDKDKHTQLLNLRIPENKANTGGLVCELHLAVGAKVMLTVNVDVSDGLVNGARGTVQAIIKTGSEVTLVLVKFDHSWVGTKAVAQSQYHSQYPEAVPISRHKAVFCIGKNKAAEVSRRQFPLVLAWATTIHKVQGLTMDQIVVDMVDKMFDAGQAYVAFSRVKTLEGLFIKNFKPANIRVNADFVSEMKRLSTQSLPSEPVPKVISLPRESWMKIGHLNVHSYLGKQEDIIRDKAMMQTNIMCFTETFLRPHQHIGHDSLPVQEECLVFRLDRLQTSIEDLAKGGIMILCPRSLQPARINIQHPPQLEILSIMATSNKSGSRMCIVAVYKCPQQPLIAFLSLLGNYITNLPQIVPTIVLGDFNHNLLSSSVSSQLLQLMSSRGFS